MLVEEVLRIFIGIVEKEAQRPRFAFERVEDFPEDPLQRVQGERIEEKAAVCFIGDLIGRRIGQDEGDALPCRRALGVEHCFLPEPFVVFDAERMAARLVSQEILTLPLPLP